MGIRDILEKLSSCGRDLAAKVVGAGTNGEGGARTSFLREVWSRLGLVKRCSYASIHLAM